MLTRYTNKTLGNHEASSCNAIYNAIGLTCAIELQNLTVNILYLQRRVQSCSGGIQPLKPNVERRGLVTVDGDSLF